VFHTKLLATANTKYLVLYAFIQNFWPLLTLNILCCMHFFIQWGNKHELPHALSFYQLCPGTFLAFVSFPSFAKGWFMRLPFGVVWLPTQCTGFVHSFTLFISVTTKCIWIELNVRNLSCKAWHCFIRPVTFKRRGFLEQ
jgi:hypothetical protein